MAVLFLNVAMIRAADTPGLWSGRRSSQRGFVARLRSCAWSWCAPRRGGQGGTMAEDEDDTVAGAQGQLALATVRFVTSYIYG